MLIDTHCHLSFKAFNDSWPDVVKRAQEKGIQMIVVGAARATSEKAIAIAEASDGVFASVGLHPTHVEDEHFDYDWFSKAADNSKVAAIGETGIDYYHLPPHPPLSPQGGRGDKESSAVILRKQEDLLRQHLTIARDKNLPVILHCRDSRTPTTPLPSNHPLPLLAKEGITSYEHLYRVITDFGYTRCVLHCFGGDWAIAQKFLDLGCLISFTGIVTYKNAGSRPSPHPLPGKERVLLLEEVVRNVPLDRFMIETDSPYLAPEPFRGKQNEPAYVEHIARAIAEIRGARYDEIAQATTENARRFFNI